jgi:hypothetical protein
MAQPLIEEQREKKGKAIGLQAFKRYCQLVGQKARKKAEEKGLAKLGALFLNIA